MPHLANCLGKSVQRKSLGAAAPGTEALNAPHHPDCLLHGIRLAQGQISPAPPVRGASMQIDLKCYQESV
jgi:hypothetical protein